MRGFKVEQKRRVQRQRERFGQRAIVVREKRRHATELLHPFGGGVADSFGVLGMALAPRDFFLYVAQIFAHRDVVYPRLEIVKVRILHGRLVMQQHARHGEFRDDAAPGGAPTAADVQVVPVSTDVGLFQVLAVVESELNAQTGAFGRRLAPIVKLGVDDVRTQPGYEHRAETRSDVVRMQELLHLGRLVLARSNLFHEIERRRFVPGMRLGQKLVIAPAPHRFRYQRIPLVLTLIVHSIHGE